MNDGLPTTVERPRQQARFARLQAWVGILLSLACLTWLVYVCTRDWADVRAALTQVDYRLVVVAALLNLASVLFRTIRWRLMFHARRAPSFRRLTAALLVGQAVNILSPARLGDLARITLADTGGTAYVLGTLMVEVTLDLLMLVTLVVFLLSQATMPAWWQGSGQTLLVVAAAAMTAIAMVVIGRQWLARVLERVVKRRRRPMIQRVVAWTSQLLLSLDTLGRTAQLMPVLACSALIWTLYGAVNYTLLGAIGERPSVLTSLFLLVVLQLGVAVPSSPGRLGVYHYLCIQALAVFGVNGPEALSYAVILHLISVIMPVTLGAVLAWRLGIRIWRTSHDMEKT